MNGMKIVNQWVVLSGISIARFADFIALRRYSGWVPIASLAPLGETPCLEDEEDEEDEDRNEEPVVVREPDDS